MRLVLMVSPHFLPGTTAGAHRVRLLAPHLAAHVSEPTVVAVDPRDCERCLDPELAELVPRSLRVVRAHAWSARWTRRLGIGDLGLRAFAGLLRACTGLLRRESFDALFVTIYPTYPALLGPVPKRRFDVLFMLDYPDPYTCVLAGLAVVLSDTAGQRPLAADLGEAALSYRPGDVAALATGLRRWAKDKSALPVAQAAVWRAAVRRWHWEHPAERGAPLAAVEEALR